MKKLDELKKLIREQVKSILTESQISDAFLTNVTNDDDGKKRIKAIKAIFSNEYSVRLRGRHSNRKEILGAKYQTGRQNDVPLDIAEYIGVYLYPKIKSQSTTSDTSGEMDSTFKDPGSNRMLSHPHP